MSSDNATSVGTSPAQGDRVATPVSQPVRQRIFFYLGALIVLLAFSSPQGGLIDIPISFFLKNKLQLEAHQVAVFRLIASVPLYLSFVFGFVRDSWSPFGMKDRGFMVLFGAICAALYVLFAFTPVSYPTLLIAVIALTASSLFITAALNGLTSVLGQQHAMTGQISVVLNTFGTFPTLAGLLAGGYLSELLEQRNADQAARILFLCGATLMGAVATYGIWRPTSVFDNVRDETALVGRPLDNLARLARHWPIYPALLIWLLWNFAPGSATPLQYFMQNTLHAKDAQWGQWNAIFAASFVPTFLVFGLLCRKFVLRTLLLWGTVVAVPQMVPLLFIHSINGALLAAVPMGLMGGVASAAYIDLIIRSSPRGLQGTAFMMSTGLYWVATRFGDVLGTTLYDHFGGFGVCVLAITVVYALILPTLLLVPSDLTNTADGQALE